MSMRNEWRTLSRTAIQVVWLRARLFKSVNWWKLTTRTSLLTSMPRADTMRSNKRLHVPLSRPNLYLGFLLSQKQNGRSTTNQGAQLHAPSRKLTSTAIIGLLYRRCGAYPDPRLLVPVGRLARTKILWLLLDRGEMALGSHFLCASQRVIWGRISTLLKKIWNLGERYLIPSPRVIKTSTILLTSQRSWKDHLNHVYRCLLVPPLWKSGSRAILRSLTVEEMESSPLENAVL